MDLFSPVALGDLQLANRVVMAPLTRLRAGDDGVPGDLLVEHYAQRAGVGLITTEGTWTSPGARSYPGQPGIVTDAQVAGWRRVTDAVHAAGGRIVMQVMHGGRVTHPGITGGATIVAPSAVAIAGEVRTPGGKLPYPVPTALDAAGLAAAREEIVAASVRALEAGMDGVEVHSANGYLLHEFLAPSANRRTDGYGGSPENRARFGTEVVAAVVEAVGAGRVGLRISPERGIQDVVEDDRADVRATYTALLEGVAPLGLAYLSVLHPDLGGDLVQGLRRTFGGPVVANSGFAAPTTRDEALALLRAGHADAVAVGRAVIANPDLVARWAGEHPENPVDTSTFYGSGPRGYTDYPTYPAFEPTRPASSSTR